MATRAKRHHLVAKSYLRRFADPKEMLTVLDRTDGREYTTSVENVAVEANFYTVAQNGAPSDVFERWMATDVEGPADAAFDRLAEERFPPSAADRLVIAKFAALQAVRGRAFREMHDTAAQKRAARGVRHHPELTPEENARLQEEAPRRFLELATSQEYRVDTMMEMAEKAVPMLLARPWVLLRTSDAPTSDLPVIPWEGTTKTAGFAVVGFAAADEIVMPVSPELVLTFGPSSGWSIPETVIAALPEWRAQLPQFVRQTSRRYVYRRPGTTLRT